MYISPLIISFVLGIITGSVGIIVFSTQMLKKQEQKAKRK